MQEKKLLSSVKIFINSQTTARNTPLLRPTQVAKSQAPELNYFSSKPLKFMMIKRYFDKNGRILSVHKRELF